MQAGEWREGPDARPPGPAGISDGKQQDITAHVKAAFPVKKMQKEVPAAGRLRTLGRG